MTNAYNICPVVCLSSLNKKPFVNTFLSNVMFDNDDRNNLLETSASEDFLKSDFLVSVSKKNHPRSPLEVNKFFK